MNWITTILKKNKKKITIPRATIADFILSECTFSAQTIIDTCTHIDRVSIYRTIELFESLDIIHPTTHIKGHQFYELHAKDHHHHTQCLGCGEATCITCPIEKTTQHTHHTLFFTKEHCTHCP